MKPLRHFLATISLGAIMKRIAIAAFTAVIGFGMMVQDAEARRFGGARTSGISRDSSVMQRSAAPAAPTKSTTPAQTTAPNQAGAATPPKPGMSRWLGPLAGLAAGIGLASLFSHFGMGEGMGNIVMMIALAMAAVFLLRKLMSSRQASPSEQYAAAGNTAPLRFEPSSRQTAPSPVVEAVTPAGDIQLPADFDVDAFLRQSKLNFVRLQTANDRGDMLDIRQFTSPEMFAEVQLDYQDRDRKTQQTNVIELNADLLDVTVETSRQLASVRFYGQLREQADATPEAFNEVWHLSNPGGNSRNWIVVGIQQA
jgi:predicted lipid-binding transport protein (Tim44 family)